MMNRASNDYLSTKKWYGEKNGDLIVISVP